MSEGFSLDMERAYYDERFLQDAARLVDSELLEQWKAAQSMQVDEAWLQNTASSAKKLLKAHIARRKALSSVKKAGRSAAITTLTAGLLLGGIYGTVEAAREPISTFFLTNRNPSNAILVPSNIPKADRYLVPEDWSCPVFPTWIPDGYQLEDSNVTGSWHWWLRYAPADGGTDGIYITITDANHLGTVLVNTEGLEDISEPTIQGVSAKVVLDTRHNAYVLTMVKDEYLVEISANASLADVIQIAELLNF